MGVDYLVCDHCERTFADCGPHHNFQIVGLDDYMACGCCEEKVRYMLKPEHETGYLWFVEPLPNVVQEHPDDKTLTRHVFCGSKNKFEKWCRKTLGVKITNYRFALCGLLHEEFDSKFQSMWIGDGPNCTKVVGPQSDLVQEIKDKITQNSTSWSSGWVSLDVAWKGKCIKRFHEQNENVLYKVNDYIRQNGLKDVPCITTSHPDYTYKITSRLMHWYSNKEKESTQKNMLTPWTNDLDEFLEDIEDELPDDHVDSWVAQEDFLNRLKKDYDSEVMRFKKKVNRVNRMIKDLAKADKANQASDSDLDDGNNEQEADAIVAPATNEQADENEEKKGFTKKASNKRKADDGSGKVDKKKVRT